jgi:tRNA(fMet)-specific endonuclease VapC
VKYLLDTNICIYWLKGNEHIEQKVLAGGIDNIFVSFITASELYYGVYKSERVDENLAMMRKLTERITVIESDDAISEAFGKLKASLESAGLIIDDADMFIAACALVHGLTLVTNNTKHFKRIKDLN